MSGSTADPGWVDEVLLGGKDDDACLGLGGVVNRGMLRSEVADRQARLTSAGIARGGSVALLLPPSLAFVANLLAAWRIGAQVTLLDHRLTAHEVRLALARVRPQIVARAASADGMTTRGYYDVADVGETHPGRPAETEHAVIQLSSGSTGPSKVIGRTSVSLLSEVERYARIDGVPREGERVVLLASMVHVLGLVGGLLYGLATGACLVLPDRLTGEGILRAIAAGTRRTTVIGVPFHIELLAAIEAPPALPQFVRMTTGGELVRGNVHESFTSRYSASLGTMYGMTELGVIATDLFGRHRPALAPAPGMALRVEDGELLVRCPDTPYVGLSDPARWADGWLRTRDAASIDQAGLVTIHGRLDSQISIGGLKVDLMEVEQTLAGLPGVVEAVVTYDGAIEAYVVVAEPAWVAGLDQALTHRLAPYKRPRRVRVVRELPRTAAGKLVRDRAVLAAAARGTAAS